MTLAELSLAYLRARALRSALNVLLLALGVAIVAALLLLEMQMRDRLARDLHGIDLVVGAKGSPMQLILSAVFHVDAPVGNIPAAAVDEFRANPMVAQVMPVALGDNFQGFRIVGTEHELAAHYGAAPAEGRLWQAPLEAVLGASVARRTGLRPGDQFVGSHGIGRGGPGHGEHPFTVTGILTPTGTVIDRLVLTSIDSVWAVHGIQAEAPPEGAQGAATRLTDRREVTALLIRYKSPLAAVGLPRAIDARTGYQAASPAHEAARLFALLGAGLDTLRGFGVLLMAAAGLSVFVGLVNALSERRYDIAVMRALGGSRARIVLQVLLEGVLIAGMGAAIGLALGHGAVAALPAFAPEAAELGLTGLAWAPAEGWLLLGALTVGVAAALAPAWLAYRTDIAATLARR